MKIREIKLPIENGETIRCIVAGRGERLGYIVGGPGSFYLNQLSCLEDVYTLVSYDALWTYSKANSSCDKKLSSITKESIKEMDHKIVNSLKRYFDTACIDGFGFSAPGSLLFEEALDYPDDFEKIIATGVGLIELDSTFSKTNDFFQRAASPNRLRAFEDYQRKYLELQMAIHDDATQSIEVFSFFDVKSKEKLEKPYKQFLAETISMAPKILFDYSDPQKSKSIILSHWKKNAFNEHIDKKFQEHFFSFIYPRLNPVSSLIDLAKTNKSVLLIYGESDYITPLPEDTLKILDSYPSIATEIMSHCGHMAYFESPDDYFKIIKKFITFDKGSSDNFDSPHKLTL